MSAEGKKKRGESGMSNAKSIPFRYGGKPCNLSLKIGSTTHRRLAGSKMLYAMILSARLPYFNPSERLLKAADETIEYIESLGRTVRA